MSGPVASVETGEILADISPDEARRLTDRIRDSVEATWSLLLEAHEQRAWAALGYSTWAEYVSAEFNMSRRRSYQLLDVGRVTRAIGEATGDVQHAAQIPYRDAEALKPHLDDVTDEIQERIAEEPDAEPDRVRDIVNDTIGRHRNAEPEPPLDTEPEFTAEELHLKFSQRPWQDSNLRPSGYDSGALSKLSYRGVEGPWGAVVQSGSLGILQTVWGSTRERPDAWRSTARCPSVRRVC